MSNYALFATELAYKAGDVMRKNFILGMKKSYKKLDSSPFTVSDTFINHMVVQAINETFPKHSVVGEEESNKKDSEYVWLCDPIDGSIPFSSGIPVSSFSLALVRNGKPIMGVVYDPFMDRMFSAEKGKGAFLNMKKISVSKDKVLKSQVMYVGWWKHSLYNLERVRHELNKKDIKIMDFCSFAYAGALVAAGEFSALIFADKYPWDVAAIKIIIEEAGGICTDLAGQDQRYDADVNGFIASSQGIHAELVTLVKEHAFKN